MSEDLFTRKEYIDSPGHADKAEGFRLLRKYYSQFVNNKTISWVVRYVGADPILRSEDRHFNDIDIKTWDLLVSGMPMAIRFRDLGDTPSPAGLVCVAKEAARLYADSLRDPA